MGVQHPDTLSSISVLSLVYEAQGKLQEAESLCSNVVDARRAADAIGEQHPNTLASIKHLSCLRAKVLMKSRATLGDQHTDTRTYTNHNQQP